MGKNVEVKPIAVISLIVLLGMLFGAVAYLVKYSDIKAPVAINPAIDSKRCMQKVKFSGNCEIAGIGYEFDSSLGKCINKTGSCRVETPFKSLNECRKTCETNIITGNELKFETIEKENYPYHEKAGNMIIKNIKDWTELWNSSGHSALPPAIDFAKDMVMAVFQGEKSTGGYSIEITKIIENKDNTEVFVKETSPGVNCMVTKSLTSPFHIVKLQKIDKEVVFKIEKATNDCN